MNDIRDKIAKLLALADSPNENEARAALLKARELMAEHKLRPEECQKTKGKDEIVLRELTGIFCTKIKNGWAPTLSAIVAENYCCKAYRSHAHGDKKVEIGFVGLSDDMEICKRIFRYAYDCVSSECERIMKENRIYDGRYARKLAEAYGYGFCDGLRKAFREQNKQREEWGLVLVVPKAVTDSMHDMGKASGFGCSPEAIGAYHYREAGKTDGEQFNPASRLGAKA